MTGSWADKAIDDMKASYEAELSTLRDRIEELERERDEWRKDFGTLCKAVVGETGLSAIEEAPKLRSRAAAAERKLGEARAETLEEAARHLDQMPRLQPVSPAHVRANGPVECAAAIRALKSGGANG